MDIPETMFAELETNSAAIDAFVTKQNALTETAFMGAAFEANAARAAAIIENPEKLGGLSQRGAWLFTFKQTTENPKGVWLRRPQSDPVEADKGWQIVFDVDAFCEADGGDWHWRGAVTAWFDPDRVMLTLSDGGSDQIRYIEFDSAAGAFVPGGFDIGPERGSVSWLDADTLLWSSAHGDDATASAWPGVVRHLTRSEGIATAESIFRAGPADLVVNGYTLPTEDGSRLTAVSRYLNIGQEQVTVFFPDGPEVLPSPDDTTVSFSATHYAYVAKQQGGVPGALMLGQVGGDVREIWRPSERQAISEYSVILLYGWVLWVVHDNLRPQLWVLDLSDPDAVPGTIAPPEGADMMWVGLLDAEFYANAGSAESPLTLNLQGLLRSPVTYVFDLDNGPDGITWRKLWQDPEQFDATGKTVELREAVSDDGTRVPYHLVRPAGAPTATPTMIYGYGGFSIALSPAYNAVMGAMWLERGGAYALAHIRGGTELGPDWHLVAKGPGRTKCFEDFAAVARDLSEAGLAAPAQIGCHGASNGGLLTGVMLNRYPDRFGAIWSAVGVYDMMRFHQFPAGRAWIDEYGDPDEAEARGWLLDYSPMHTVPDKATQLPPALIATSTNDDRVDPSHARRYAAALRAQGHAPWFYQHGGGHGGGGSSKARAREAALGYGFLAKSLGLG